MQICELGNYQCPNCPDERWQSILGAGDEECWVCGKLVAPEGCQKRVCNHLNNEKMELCLNQQNDVIRFSLVDISSLFALERNVL